MSHQLLVYNEMGQGDSPVRKEIRNSYEVQLKTFFHQRKALDRCAPRVDTLAFLFNFSTDVIFRKAWS